MGNSKTALKFCRCAREIAVQINDPVSNCHAVSIESMAELDQGNTEKALMLFEEAVILVENNQIKSGTNEDFDDLLEKLDSGSIEHRMPSNWQVESD